VPFSLTKELVIKQHLFVFDIKMFWKQH